jgi:hypothetical protein
MKCNPRGKKCIGLLSWLRKRVCIINNIDLKNVERN